MKQLAPPLRPVKPRQRFTIIRLLQANFYDLLLLLRESWIVLAGFGLLALAGTFYLHGYYGLGFVAALYETLKLLTLQSGLSLPADPLGQMLFFLLPLLGLALIFQSVLNFGRLLLDKGSRREAWQVALASTYRDHVIVCGLGRVSLRVVTQLREAGYDAVVVEREWGTEFVERMLNRKVPVILGDAREIATLRQAGLPRARAIVACINDDLLNIEIALTARAARPDIRVVLRVFNETLDRNLERQFGDNSAFSASALAAPTFAAAAVSRMIEYILVIGGGLLGITRIVVQPGSPIAGPVQMIEQVYNIRVLHHIGANGELLAPALMRRLNSGDIVTLLGSLAALEALRLKNRGGDAPSTLRTLPLQHPTKAFDTVIVCGLGKVGYRVVHQLHRLDPRPRIVVIRRGDPNSEFAQHIDGLDGVTTIIGDAREQAVLQAAGIDQAYSVAALTADDLINLQIGLAAQRHREDVQIVLRVFSDALAGKLADMFGIRTIYGTSELASPTLAAAAILGGISQAFVAGNYLFSTDRIAIHADSPLADCAVADIRTSHAALVIELCRGDTTLVLPALDTLIAPGDHVTLLAPLEALVRLRRLATRRA
jgi:Trk K+ transport system NAD-binding subunit